MTSETESLVVLALDQLLTTIDHILEELDEHGGGTNVANAEKMLLEATIQINVLIDRVVEDRVDDGNVSGAV